MLCLALSACDNPQRPKNATAKAPDAKVQKADNAQKPTEAPKPGDKKVAKTDAKKDGKMSEKEKDIRKLLVLTGSAKLGKQVIDSMIVNYRKAMPQVPGAFWDDFQKEANAEALIELIVPIYDKHFTHEDIKGMITFYETPLGKKMTAAMPQITQESMAEGRKWGMQLGAKIQSKLKEKGHLKGNQPAQN